MDDKYIDRGKDAPSTMITPRTLALSQAQAEEFRRRAEAAEAALDRYRKALEQIVNAGDDYSARIAEAAMGQA